MGLGLGVGVGVGVGLGRGLGLGLGLEKRVALQAAARGKAGDAAERLDDGEPLRLARQGLARGAHKGVVAHRPALVLDGEVWPDRRLPREEGLTDQRRRRFRSVGEEPCAGLRGHRVGHAAILLGGLPRVSPVELNCAAGTQLRDRHQPVRQPSHEPAVGVGREACLRRLQVQGCARASAGSGHEARTHERLANTRVRPPDHVNARPHAPLN